MVESKAAQSKLNFSFKESNLKKRLHSETDNPELKLDQNDSNLPKSNQAD